MMVLREKRFSNNLLRLRKTSGLSQYNLVAEMQLLGSSMSRSTYAKIEIGERNIKVTDLVVLRKIYDVAYEEFFKGIELL